MRSAAVIVGALEDLLVVALVAVGGGDVVGGLVFLGRGFGVPLLGDVVNLSRVSVIRMGSCNSQDFVTFSIIYSGVHQLVNLGRVNLDWGCFIS